MDTGNSRQAAVINLEEEDSSVSEGREPNKRARVAQHIGKPKDPIWSYFAECTVQSSDGKSLTHQKCLLCGSKVSAQAPRLKKHYSKCSKNSKEFPEEEEKTGMSRRSANNRAKSNSIAVPHQDFGSGCGSDELGLEDKVCQLQETLKTFRAEVDLKMTIMEQILTTRNEQFLVQKKLLEREHALYESVLTHWKNTAELAANGLTLKFSESGEDVDVVCDESGEPVKDSMLGKRTSSSPAMARRGRKKRLRAKLQDSDGSDGNSDQPPSDNENGHSWEGDREEGSEDDEDGMVRKVFLNYYSEKQQVYGERSNNPVWKHFLREENGKSAMCKICDGRGLQKILKIHDGSTSTLHRHLKMAHQAFADSNKNMPTPVSASGEAHSSSSSVNPVDPLDDATLLSGEGSRLIQSPVWDYFTMFKDSEGKKARCNCCYEQGTSTLYLIANGSTSRLHDHIKKTHGVNLTFLAEASVPSIFRRNVVEGS